MFDPAGLEKRPKTEIPEAEPASEILPGSEPKAEQEPRQESREEEDQDGIEKLKRKLDEIFAEKRPAEAVQNEAELREKKIKEYQERHLPEYLRGEKGLVSNALTRLWEGRLKLEEEGEENIPEEGPFIVIWNHFGGKDVPSLLRTFEDFDLHFAIAKQTWWNRSAILRWFLKKLRTIPVEESLANLKDEEKEEAAERQNTVGRGPFKRIIDREKQGRRATNIEFVHQSVAALSRGDVLAVSPAGLWLNAQGATRDEPYMRQGYRGIELLARRYENLTGEELPIVPVAYIEKGGRKGEEKIIVGKPLMLSENKSGLKDTDWAMAHVAAMLPEEQRGYYAEAAEKIIAQEKRK